MQIKEVVAFGHRHFLPNLSIDLVIIGYGDDALQCLLLKVGDKWLLPGGYVKREESVEEATVNILRTRTGLEDTYLKFLAVFGGKDRQFSEVSREFMQKLGMEWSEDYWMNNRFVSLTYYSLVNKEKTHPKISFVDEAFAWFDFDDLPEMWMDHRDIVLTAREQLTRDAQREYSAHNLLPEVFTMPDLHRLHQAIVGSKVDRSRFQKTMLATGLFERLPRVQKTTPGRNPYQYRLKK
ncbi:NUDIX domain-containing protein [Lewinella sp. W8]|uniref:NUDIX hydrolase n=1 Tax=Lewinella sp. W8 TaxID=2528208 RepID=UPI001067EC0C|nr:NUDIX domain-containing protein [Lewinella sp. W8]MTB52582.1 hypothetical protein [Lewinella sp. W8]